MPKQTYDNYVININLEWICPQCYKSPLDVSQSDCPENTSISSPDMYEDLRTTLGNSGLKLAHINIRGLLSKLNEITLLLEESNIDILAITETHLDKSIGNKTVNIDGYQVERHDRDKYGGGCLLYWKENLDVTVNKVINAAKDMESVWIDLHIHSQRYLIGGLYRLPDRYDFYDKLKIILTSIWTRRKNIILLGDLNSDLLFRGKTSD